ncbi:glycosyltransferase family 2 protein [Sulfuracidifex metallicus]|uniref:glycosyltransferase family 2 protein n=1 Tax=Sulfuracidifex metallicus TaxID=47303 RepID=UPI002272A756|nr:glycosyltransferase family 2 protein [Sulfuracidifex metallicus]MCY0851018.1 glycosyltransferase family 2 protein [Sulfuracidifex metallicus]
MEEIPIVVLNYNGLHLLKSYLDSVLNTEYPNEVVVVDNGSKDGSVEYLKSKGVKTIPLDKNYGTSYARNVAIRTYKTKFMAFLDNDVEVPKEWLNPLVDVIKGEEKIAATQSVYTEWTWGDQPSEIPWFSTAAALTRRDVLERIGGFDEHYFFYWEDTELSWRLYRAGYKVLMVPKSRVYHEAHGTFKKLPSKFTSYLTMRNQLILLLTYYNKKKIVSNFIPLYMIRFLQSFKAPNRGAKLKAVLTLGKEIGYVMKKRSEIRKLTVNTDDRFLSYLGRDPFGFVELRSVAEGIRYKMSTKATI